MHMFPPDVWGELFLVSRMMVKAAFSQPNLRRQRKLFQVYFRSGIPSDRGFLYPELSDGAQLYELAEVARES